MAEAHDILMIKANVEPDTPAIRGYDFNKGLDLQALLDSMLTTGFQATSFGQAVEEVNRMINWRLSDDPVTDDTPEKFRDPKFRASVRTKIFLGYTSNMSSAGTREHIRYLVQNKMVDVIVTTAGGVEEDFIKCLGDTYIGDFHLKGEDLRKQGLNRIGNMVIPNTNYCRFEEWIMPILEDMYREQEENGVNWTPSKMIHRLGREMGREDCIAYWAWKNNIPIFSPALTDGSIGDMLMFHSLKRPGLRLDLVEDVRLIDETVMHCAPAKTGMILVGGGVAKHHICNANLLRNGADFAVYINTAQEFDGSDSGARPDEAISWGKIALHAKPVKVYADATLILPLLIAQTFYKNFKPKDA
eukprot:CAMPEP_0202901004 /NCGR_PEP_ID=MMETSP1392-20130828/12674_1 /ASSEMBLY_ACC=CAM_ASM_000868 /TAXON_ID=225041 /ORGANISM="Chlamydomonas chlamydogama, Strain SAG 11-48b" /LENGTH=357 /DNA_ID=CAMNT_0049587485 /DNA_START=147 /DNA_END=1220 /DNA_ORIENTATION=+